MSSLPFPSSALPLPAALALTPVQSATPSPSLMTALIAFGLTLLVGLFTHPPLRRTVVTFWEIGCFALRYLRRRLRGERATAGPIELRRTFERLGPTYIKFGQLIASSNGLFPERYVTEFQLCLDRVPPEPWPVVLQTLTQALGRPPQEIFAAIEPVPLASASIAQVYAVKLREADGTLRELVVKVQRRHLPELVRADIGMLQLAADFLDQLPRIRNANPRGIVAEFARSIAEELDFLGEVARLDRWNQIMKELGRSDVTAPHPVHRLCTSQVLTMERLLGVRVDDIAEIRRRGMTTEQAEDKLIAGMHAWFQSLIRYGFFHGDVHAGNLMLLDDGRIGFLDFGIIGRLDEKRRHQIAGYLMAFATRDFVSLAKTLVDMGAADGKTCQPEWEQFALDLEEAYSPFLGKSVKEIDYSQVIPKMIRISRQHGARLPSEFVLVTRQLLYFDRYAKLLAPSLNLFTDQRLLLTIGAEFMSLGLGLDFGKSHPRS
jgi:predicted unusual protein kinase regulating ubiquinone biosynthesis (AarF/ABC1/UbiB family)